MAEIRPYTSQVLAQGQINTRRTTAEDMGGGPGLANIGAAISNFGEVVQQKQEQDDVTNVHTLMAKARSDWTQTMADRQNQAQPGDDSFVPTVQKDLQSYFDASAPTIKTRTGQQLFARMSADMTAHFTDQAIGVQSHLDGQNAVNQYTGMIQNLGRVAFSDPSQYDSTLKQAQAAIDDPKGIYARVPQTTRDELKRKAEDDLSQAVMHGLIQNRPEDVLAKVSPENLAKFKQTPRVLQAEGLSTAVKAYAPSIQQSATAYGVDPNIMAAQIKQESGGNVNAVSPKGAAGISQFMPATAARYGVDVTNADSSIKGQAAYMSDLLKMFNGDYRKALAGYNWGEGNVQKAVNTYGEMWMDHAPTETKNYVSKIMADATANATSDGSTPPPDMGPKTPAMIGIPAFDRLSWQQQYSTIQTAEQQVRANQVRDQQNIALMQQKKHEAQEASLQAMLPKLQNNSLTPDDVLKDPNLDFAHKEHMLNAIRITNNKMDNTDPKVFNEVFAKVIAPDADSGKITDPDQIWNYVGKGVSLEDANKLRAIIMGKGTPLMEQKKAFVAMAKSQITNTTPTSPIPDPEGDKQYYGFLNEFDHEFDAKLKQGKTLGDLLNPQSRDYLGWVVDKYKRNAQQRMSVAATILREQSGKITPIAEPRKAGESLDDYELRKRTK